jgi:hypothetical protein
MKLRGLILILFFFIFSLHTASAEEMETRKAEEESFPGYIFRELPRNLLQDSKESFQPLNLAILGFAIQATVVLDQSGADQEIQKEVKNSLKGYGKIGTFGGVWYTIAGITLSPYIVGRLRDDEKIIDAGKALIESQIITQVATNALKFTVRRERPDGSARTSFLFRLIKKKIEGFLLCHTQMERAEDLCLCLYGNCSLLIASQSVSI